jgi:TatA/E family protein of Tat protein translocase
MGLSGLSFGHLLVVLLVIVLVFGTKSLGRIGADLGAAIKGFRRAISNGDAPSPLRRMPLIPPRRWTAAQPTAPSLLPRYPSRPHAMHDASPRPRIAPRDGAAVVRP